MSRVDQDNLKRYRGDVHSFLSGVGRKHTGSAGLEARRSSVRALSLTALACSLCSVSLGAPVLRDASGGVLREQPVHSSIACNEQTASPAHPKLNTDAASLAALFRSPQNAQELLVDLKLVWEKRLLGEPALFSDVVLQKLFAARSIEWVGRGEPGFLDFRLIRPSRVARIAVGIPGLEGLAVAVGVNHKCVVRSEDSAHPGARAEARTYDAGYIQVTWPPSARLEMGRVLDVFGHDPNIIDPSCPGRPFLTYPKAAANSDMSLNDVLVITDPIGPKECEARQAEPIRHSDPVRQIVLKYWEDDGTHRLPPQP